MPSCLVHPYGFIYNAGYTSLSLLYDEETTCQPGVCTRMFGEQQILEDLEGSLKGRRYFKDKALYAF